MSTNATQQIWVNGPSGYSFIFPDTGIHVFNPPNSERIVRPYDYEGVTAAVQGIVRKVGKPLEINGLTSQYVSFPLPPVDGNVLVVTYIFPIEISTSDGKSVAQAKWLVIQWKAPGKPTSLIYGDVPWEPEGAFEIPVSMNDLEQALPPVN
jgi:hypothetical protein